MADNRVEEESDMCLALAGSRFRYGSISWEPDADKIPTQVGKYWVKVRIQALNTYDFQARPPDWYFY
jgi:hypothetical protein